MSISVYVTIHTRDGQKDFSGLRPLIEQNIYAQIRANIQQQVDSQFPIGTTDFKTKLVDQQYALIKSSGTLPINSQNIKISDIVDQNLANVRQNFQFPDGQTYMGSIDPYYYYNLGSDYFDHGYSGDKLDANGKPLISKMLAPQGVAGSFFPEFNDWIVAKTFALNNLNSKSTQSEKIKALFMLPVWLCLPAVFACYFLIRRFSSDLYALFGTLICMTTGIFVSRTLGGSIDNDPYYVIMPLIITAIFVYALVEKRMWLAVALAAIAGLAQGFMVWTLGNAWFIFFFIMVATIMYLAYLFIESIWHKNYDNLIEVVKKEGYIFGAYLVSSTIFHYLFTQGDNIFVAMYTGIFGSINGIASFDPNLIWPNVLSSVAELNPANFAQIVSSVGGATIFILGLMGLVLMTLDFEWKRTGYKWTKWATIVFALAWFSAVVQAGAFQSLIANSTLLFLITLFVPVAVALVLAIWNNNTHAKIALVILLSVWMAGTTYMSFNGVRFIMLLGPTFAITFAFTLYYVASAINSFCAKELGVENFVLKNIFGILVAALIFYSVFSLMYTDAKQMSSQPAILFDRAWFDAMDVVRAQTSPGAIITSWWDFGHYYRAIGERAVTFDGASQTTPQAHWVGRLLMENNETVARDILRMLDCGANGAFDKMLALSHDPTRGILVNKLIYKTFGLPLDQDDALLQNNEYFNFTKSQTTEIMSLLSCDNPPESIFITSGDMVGKASVWAHWGSWDFTKKYVFDNYRNSSVKAIATSLHEDPMLISQYVNELNQISAKSKSQNIKYTDLINQWFAPYPGYYPGTSGYFTPCKETNGIVTCDNSVTLSLSDLNISSNMQGPPIGRIIMLTNTTQSTYSRTVPAGTMTADALFIQTGPHTYTNLIAITPLGGSLFTRLFFLDGQTTKYFEPIGGVFNSQTQGKITMWRTNWTAN